MALSKVEAIAIGGFDGMHVGHKALFDQLGEHGAIVVIETGYANLTPGCEREKHTHYPIFYYPLDDIRHLEGAEFVEHLLVQFQHLQKIVVGYDFHFGKDRRYSHQDLKNFFTGEVCVVDQVTIDNDSVHSHKIRAKLQIGDIRGANRFLGHNYCISGMVIKGQGIGKKELVPTLNLDCKGFLLPEEGVYAALTRINDEEHFSPSVVFLGHRISTDGSYAIESHILNRDIEHTHRATICFTRFIRKNQKFETLELLKEAIQGDILNAKNELCHLSL
ncbi:MAG TPA: bifunctional riboflavin kinase/FAD synthetase [Sulfuricurvum sp.]|nr:MAG: bifunctional riboflavin kinase/FMN adenylyltransferase [Campylobacterales bacterium 16-40-21]OZA04227.1 MAG: bifunctional riboflavin kinase/FMN adenylyltransferase [Sulfuricurvum sp. 17-40-25]HQS66238.1 bifunctional riboflavin kinase/FAD synthetase [Sulfuricurvum sp.]HQT36847.1 bifunctional riboflavin kinase/FAD synthetase [Sulfuricurvum sp.]